MSITMVSLTSLMSIKSSTGPSVSSYASLIHIRSSIILTYSSAQLPHIENDRFENTSPVIGCVIECSGSILEILRILRQLLHFLTIPHLLTSTNESKKFALYIYLSLLNILISGDYGSLEHVLKDYLVMEPVFQIRQPYPSHTKMTDILLMSQ